MSKNIKYINNIPYRGIFIIYDWCKLEDCSQPECHNCFPVKNCVKHEKCKK